MSTDVFAEGCVSVEEYLAYEAASRFRHEYLDGVVIAMVDEDAPHPEVAACNGLKLTENEYLASEGQSEVRREYLGGRVYALPPSNAAHDRIAANLVRILKARLRGRDGEVFGLGMRLRAMSLFGEPAYYYPDAMIARDATDAGREWRERPAALFEIVSGRSPHMDHGEKRTVYPDIASLQASVRIEERWPAAALDRRTDEGWQAEWLTGLDKTIQLPELDLELPLAELYAGVEFSPTNGRAWIYQAVPEQGSLRRPLNTPLENITIINHD